eukprot:scaffold940_cov201-Alexandrium_tamarense.AAC.3
MKEGVRRCEGGFAHSSVCRYHLMFCLTLEYRPVSANHSKFTNERVHHISSHNNLTPTINHQWLLPRPLQKTPCKAILSNTAHQPLTTR